VIRAILFDLDGVLIDSTRYHVEAWKEVLKPLGITLDPSDIYLTEGSKAIDIARRILRKNGVKLSEPELEELIQKKRERYREITQAGLQRGVWELIQAAKERDLKLALVTGSVWHNIRRVVPDEVIRQFDEVITGDDVTNGKPNPEPYLKASERLGISPSHCLAIENAPFGIRSAKAAGMRCVAIQSTLPKEYLEEADAIFRDLEEIRTQLDDLLSKGPE